MRTKYGSQRQILEVAELLGTDETLRFMAVANGPSQPGRNNHGLVALTDQRLIFVPSGSGNERVVTDMATVSALLWTKAARTGVLTVIGPDQSSSYSDVSSADGRELMALAVRLFPAIKRVGHL